MSPPRLLSFSFLLPLLIFVRLLNATASLTHHITSVHPTGSNNSPNNNNRVLFSDATSSTANGPSPSASGSPPFPACTFTHSPPKRVSRPASVTRCLDAKQWSCCEACDDWVNGLQIIATNTSGIVALFAPSLVGLFKDKTVEHCALLDSLSECQFLIEQTASCATNCNPDQGSYFTSTPGWQAGDRPSGTLSICQGMSERLFEACKDIPVPGGVGSVSLFFPSSLTFTTTFFSAAASLYANITVQVVQGTSGCYNGPSLLPSHSYCCDPLNAPPGCSASQVNNKFPSAVDFIGHPVNDAACSNQSAATSPGAAPGPTPWSPSSSPSPSPPSGSSSPSPPPPPVSAGQGKGVTPMSLPKWLVMAIIAALWTIVELDASLVA